MLKMLLLLLVYLPFLTMLTTSSYAADENGDLLETSIGQLTNATIFGFGVRDGEPPSARKTDTAFQLVFSHIDAKDLFINIFNNGNIHAKCYALCALQKLDINSFTKLSETIDKEEAVRTINGCVVSEPKAGELIDAMLDGQYAYLFVKDTH